MELPIATRTLIFERDGERKSVDVLIFAPRMASGCYECRYEIRWPDEANESRAVGEDSVQALILALQKIGADLNCSNAAKLGELGWFEPGEGVGFPVPIGIRDLLSGWDAKHF